MTLKRMFLFSVLGLLLVPGAAFADTLSLGLAGGSWTESGSSFTLTDGPTTLQTGSLTSFFFFALGDDTGSISTNGFSCSGCVTSVETISGFLNPSILLSGTIADGDITGEFSADLAGKSIFSTSGTITSGSIDLNIPASDPATPAPEPSTWVLLLAGLTMFGTAALSRKMGWLSQTAEQVSGR